MIAVGVASPMAQGQAIKSTLTAATKAKRSSGGGPRSSQPTKVSSATRRTMGTNTAAIRSARRWIGGLPAWASSTRRMIWASRVSAPTRVAR
jgi:hypothetical protein